MKLVRRSPALDPPGMSSRTFGSASLNNPLREIHNHHQNQNHPHKQPRLSHQQQSAVVLVSSSSSSSSSSSFEGKPHQHARQLQQHQRRHKQDLAGKAGSVAYRNRHLHASSSSLALVNKTESNARSQRKRRVQFVQANKNKRYDNPYKLRPQDHHKLWYTPAEIRGFSRQVRESVRPHHPHYNTWTHTLHRVYHAFLALEDAHEIMAILEATPTTQVFHPAGLGMERRAIALVHEDTQSRRRQLLAAVHKCQAAPVPDPWLRAQMLREMCRSVSKPSRLYARHIAHMTAVAA